MIKKDARLAENIFEKPLLAATREGFGKGVVEAGRADERVVVLTADLSESTQSHHFQKEFPSRFVQFGVAEQNLATVASGMAAAGKVPFFTSFAAFNPGRNWEQIRTTIAINNMHAICCGMHAGLQTGPDGATHQALEDIALMRALPRFTVISPCDAEEGRKATIAAARTGTPVYLRFGREKMPTMTTVDTPFEIGKGIVFWESATVDVALLFTGPVGYNALLAARKLEEEGIGSAVVNIHTIKPIDSALILEYANKAGALVSVEEHQVNGGLGGAIAEVLAKGRPTPMEFIGVQDRFGESGEAKELWEHYGLGISAIVEAAKKAISRK